MRTVLEIPPSSRACVGAALARIAGCLSEEGADAIEKAIEEGVHARKVRVVGSKDDRLGRLFSDATGTI
jgi:hypothetical protein